MAISGPSRPRPAPRAPVPPHGFCRKLRVRKPIVSLGPGKPSPLCSRQARRSLGPVRSHPPRPGQLLAPLHAMPLFVPVRQRSLSARQALPCLRLLECQQPCVGRRLIPTHESRGRRPLLQRSGRPGSMGRHVGPSFACGRRPRRVPTPAPRNHRRRTIARRAHGTADARHHAAPHQQLRSEHRRRAGPIGVHDRHAHARAHAHAQHPGARHQHRPRHTGDPSAMRVHVREGEQSHRLPPGGPGGHGTRQPCDGHRHPATPPQTASISLPIHDWLLMRACGGCQPVFRAFRQASRAPGARISWGTRLTAPGHLIEPPSLF